MLAESFWQFVKGILKRLYWLIPSLFADPYDIAERWFNTVILVPPYLFWVLILVGFFIAAFLSYHDLRINKIEVEQKYETLKKIQPTTLQRRNRLSIADWNALRDVSIQMDSVHGHSDRNGLQSDMLAGYSASDLMSKDCTRCGKPRNQKGDRWIT